jgi:hypothetical protein
MNSISLEQKRYSLLREISKINKAPVHRRFIYFSSLFLVLSSWGELVTGGILTFGGCLLNGHSIFHNIGWGSCDRFHTQHNNQSNYNPENGNRCLHSA